MHPLYSRPYFRAAIRWSGQGPVQRCRPAASRQGAQLGGVAQKAFHLAFAGAQALSLTHHPGFGIDLPDQFIRQIADRYLAASGDVDLLSDGSVAICNGHEAGGRILDVIEIPRGRQAA